MGGPYDDGYEAGPYGQGEASETNDDSGCMN